MRKLQDLPNYGVTRDGMVYSYRNQRYLKPWKSVHKRKGGTYSRLRVTLQGKVYLVHRLVAMAYIPNPDNLPMINHIDCNPLNNHVDNLEWCTARENTLHAIKHGRHVAFKNRVLTDAQVRQIRELYISMNPTQISRTTGVDRTTINGILFGRTYRTVV
jgi:hypothetical protein